jgi:hypothetical protein
MAMPKFRVLIERKVDVYAKDEDAAKSKALALLDPDDVIAWEIESDDVTAE